MTWPVALTLPARLVRLELGLVGAAARFAWGGWRRPPPPGFGCHRDSGLRLLLPALPLLALGDGLLLEWVVLPNAPPWLRVAIHLLAAYGLVWLVGLYASVRERPHQLAGGVLTLQRGLLRRVEVPVAAIASLAPLPELADEWKARAYRRGAIRVDVAGPRVLELRLHAPVRATGILGEGRPGTRVLVAVDEPERFTAAVRRAAGLAAQEPSEVSASSPD